MALRLPKAVMVSSASMNVFQHKSFPLTEKRPVISAWNAGNAARLTTEGASYWTKTNHTVVITRSKDKLNDVFTQSAG